jgi:hypothetical protein
MAQKLGSLNFAKHIPKPSRSYLDSEAMRDPEIMNEVKSSLAALAAKSPGRAIEVRVPPYAAIQCGEGPTHTRGTPPNVIEMDAATWLSLASGETSWADAMATGAISASGVRADLSELLPLRMTT